MGFTQLYETFSALEDPNFWQDVYMKFYRAWFEADRWQQYFKGLGTTIQVTVMALLIGVIAFLMRFADFPVAPFLIGYVLSAQLEYRLGQAAIYKGDMPLTEYLFSAPVALVLFAVSACLLLAPMLRPLWAGRRK